jgi:hypothetical protein
MTIVYDSLFAFLTLRSFCYIVFFRYTTPSDYEQFPILQDEFSSTDVVLLLP